MVAKRAHFPSTPSSWRGFLMRGRGPVTATTVIPLHTLIREQLQRLRAARDDGDPNHVPERCSGACLICSNQRALNRLLDKVPRQETT